MHDELTSIDAMASRFDELDRPFEQGVGPKDDPVVDTIGASRLRDRLDVVARIAAIEPCTHPLRYVDVLVDDGTGALRCRLFGRHSMGGFELGQLLRVAGRMTLHLGRECVCNPAYELCDPPEGGGVASS